MLALGPMVAIAASFAVLSAGSAPSDRVSADLARFAQTQIDSEFLAYHNALYTSCPYSLGTYSYIELSGLRRVYRVLKPNGERLAGMTGRRELSLQIRRARYYWSPGKRWIAGEHPPTLRYEAEQSNGTWSFRAEQHICARHEPQRKPSASAIPKL